MSKTKKTIERVTYKVWTCVEKHVEYTDGTDKYSNVSDNIVMPCSAGTFNTLEEAEERTSEVFATFGDTEPDETTTNGYIDNGLPHQSKWIIEELLKDKYAEMPCLQSRGSVDEGVNDHIWVFEAKCIDEEFEYDSEADMLSDYSRLLADIAKAKRLAESH